MSMLIFGRRERKARKEHFCDVCCNHIQRGNLYATKAWKVGRGQIIHLNEHVHPECPPHEFDAAVAAKLPIEMNVMLALETRVVEKVVLAVDGSLRIESETQLVTSSISMACDENDADDDETPF